MRPGARRLLSRLAPDLTPLRESRDLRLLLGGNAVSNLGAQATLVALPYEIYVETGSVALTGLLGVVALVPLVVMSLAGGAIADRVDRRRFLLVVTMVLAAASCALCAYALAGLTPIVPLFVLGGAIAGLTGAQNVARAATVPGLTAPEHMAATQACYFAIGQVALIAGPALGGVLLATTDVWVVYAFDALTSVMLVGAVLAMTPQPAPENATHQPIGRAVVEGLRLTGRSPAIRDSFALDLVAMTFGMPRALFPVLALHVYHAGPAGVGVLQASVAVGAAVAALTTGWVSRAQRLGSIAIGAVAVWSMAILLSGLAGTIVLAALALAIAGAGDAVSSVCRATIVQTTAPVHLRGRVNAVSQLVVQSGPRLGDLRSGIVGSALGASGAVVSGGLICIAGVSWIALAAPSLRRYRVDDAVAGLAETVS